MATPPSPAPAAAPPTPPAAAPKPPAAAAPPPKPAAPPPPRAGAAQDVGVVRHDALHVERWTVAGTTKVIAEADAGHVEIRGTVAIGGAFSADDARAVGSLDVGGPVTVRGALFVDGTLGVRSPLHAGGLELRGSARCAGDVRADAELTVRGSLHAPSLHASSVLLRGSAEVPGDLEAGRVDAQFLSDSRLGRIRAGSVRLRGRLPTLVDRAFFRHTSVSVERIDAEKVELEAVHVAFVHAPEVVLGRGASVGEVEGTIVRRHPSSHVGPESKSSPPYGLRR